MGIQGIAVQLVPIYIKNQETKILIDSGTSGNFVSKDKATRLGLYLVQIVLVEASMLGIKGIHYIGSIQLLLGI